jgi:hypothetical protein
MAKIRGRQGDRLTAHSAEKTPRIPPKKRAHPSGWARFLLRSPAPDGATAAHDATAAPSYNWHTKYKDWILSQP